MRFTQGYWLTRTDFDMSYATQCVRVIPGKNQMEVIACCHPVRSRGEMLDGPTLHVTFSAPRKNIIRVKLTHFEGTRQRGPFFGLNEEEVQTAFAEDEQYASFTSGELTARVLKAEDFITYEYDGETGYYVATGVNYDKPLTEAIVFCAQPEPLTVQLSNPGT